MSAVGHLWVYVIVVLKSFKLKTFPGTNEKPLENLSPSGLLEWGFAFKIYNFCNLIKKIFFLHKNRHIRGSLYFWKEF